MIQCIILPFFKILQNTSKYKGLRSYINLWKNIVRKSINSCLYASIFKTSYIYGAVVQNTTALFTYSIYSILSQFFSYFNQTNKRTSRLSLYLQQNGCHTMHRIYVMYDSHFYLNNMKFCLYLSTIQRLFIFIYRKCMDIQI